MTLMRATRTGRFTVLREGFLDILLTFQWCEVSDQGTLRVEGKPEPFVHEVLAASGSRPSRRERVDDAVATLRVSPGR